MEDIGNYIGLVNLFIAEAAKFLLVVISSVICGKIWRFLLRNRDFSTQTVLIATLFTIFSLASTYCCIKHSLSRLYYYYGNQAFENENFASAANLFADSLSHWKNIEIRGKLGVVLLFLNQEKAGLALLRETQRERGSAALFEQFHEGLYFFLKDEPLKAIPLLEKASENGEYRMQIVRIFSIIQLDKGNLNEALRLYSPIRQTPVENFDQALIMLSILALEGNISEAKKLFQQYFSENMPSFWKKRYSRMGKRFGFIQ
ncbi:MAG: hypothetical protein HQM10_06125 [Candidatus Riflebacteria bacterium]|nr:hypothetical protein [Candidatus Riflebacteria bacterium]